MLQDCDYIAKSKDKAAVGSTPNLAKHNLFKKLQKNEGICHCCKQTKPIPKKYNKVTTFPINNPKNTSTTSW